MESIRKLQLYYSLINTKHDQCIIIVCLCCLSLTTWKLRLNKASRFSIVEHSTIDCPAGSSFDYFNLASFAIFAFVYKWQFAMATRALPSTIVSEKRDHINYGVGECWQCQKNISENLLENLPGAWHIRFGFMAMSLGCSLNSPMLPLCLRISPTKWHCILPQIEARSYRIAGQATPPRVRIQTPIENPSPDGRHG